MSQSTQIKFHLPSSRVCHVFGRDQVAQAPAEALFGFYPGEDTAGGAPFKITVKPALSQFYELSFTIEEAMSMRRNWNRWLRQRSKIPNNHTDNVIN